MLLTHFVRWILSRPSSSQSLERPMVIKTGSLFPTPGMQLVVDPQDQWVTSRIEEKTTCALDDHPQSYIVTLDTLQVFPGTWKISRVNSLRADEAPSVFLQHPKSEPWQAANQPRQQVGAADRNFNLFFAIADAAGYADLSQLLYMARQTLHQCTPSTGKEPISCFPSLSGRAQVSLQPQT